MLIYENWWWVPRNWCILTVMLEKTLERPLDCKETKPVHPKRNQSWIVIGKSDCWSWNSNALATWCKELTHLKRPWCWESLKAGGEGDDRGWGGWMASPTRRTWIWVNSRSWWWTGRPGLLWSMGSQRVGHDWVTELKWKTLQMVTAAIKLKLTLGRKAMINLDSILKSRDVTLPTKVRLVKALVFPVVMYGCVSWTIQKAEHQRIVIVLLNCGFGEDSWESLGLQGDPTSSS